MPAIVGTELPCVCSCLSLALYLLLRSRYIRYLHFYICVHRGNKFGKCYNIHQDTIFVFIILLLTHSFQVRLCYSLLVKMVSKHCRLQGSIRRTSHTMKAYLGTLVQDDISQSISSTFFTDGNWVDLYI